MNHTIMSAFIPISSEQRAVIDGPGEGVREFIQRRTTQSEIER